MKEQQNLSNNNPTRPGTDLFSRFYSNLSSYIALLALSYVLILTITYSLGYFAGSTEFQHSRVITQCADPVPSELVYQMVINRAYNGTSPYENFIPPVISSSFQPIRRRSYGAVYKTLIQKVRPKTIIKFGTFSGGSATYMANLTSQLGLDTQILCLDDFHGWRSHRDLFEDMAMPTGDVNQFIQNVISQNLTESILPIPLSTPKDSDKLCKWGIFGDLVEVRATRDFHSVWSDIIRAYRLLRPGGVIFGHFHSTSYYNKSIRKAVRLFARVNKFKVKADGQHWMIDSA